MIAKPRSLFFRRLCIPAAALVLMTLGGAAKADPSINAELSASSGLEAGEHGSRFGCNDKIFAAIDVLDLPAGDHRLEADWIDPTGKTREHIDYPFSGSGATRITIWLKLHPPKGSTLFGFFNPSMGMEDFIGIWQLKLRLNKDTNFATQFEVVC